jgi:hypothetical protein
MRKLFFASLITFTCIIFYGCSKSNKNASSASTEWTFNGNTYKGVITGYDSLSAFPILSSKDSALNTIYLVFNSRPTANSTYTVVENVMDSATINPYVTISLGSATSNISYNSTGKTGDKVNVTITGGKLHAEFSNITILSTVDITTVSGTLIQD